MVDKNKRLSRLYLDQAVSKQPQAGGSSSSSSSSSAPKAAPASDGDEKVIPPAKIGYEDMTKMEDMDLNGVLNNLKDRYKENLVYTYTSSILVAINPFKRLPIYSKAWVKYYKGKRIGILAPHVFAIAEASYNAMVETSVNQAVLVSGESGAGKTETTKLILQFLSARTDRQSNIETMVLESVPVLEAFGNAKTGRNDNSSRFGKFIEIQFDGDHYICGSKITPYLLEKSRIISQSKGERNYHIFYQLTQGASAEEKQSWHLTKATDYKFTNGTGCISIKGVDEAEEYKALKSAMDIFEISREMQNDIFKIVAACLHLGNVEYVANGEGSLPKGENSKTEIGYAAELLGFETAALEYALMHKKIKMRSEIINKPMNVEQALDQTNALIKYLYSEMFEWLVRKLNECTYTEGSTNWIGVLDIFGFELFEHNSFEQFLINYANEKLQNFFNHHIFKLEQVEYEKEGIDWTAIDFVDNQPTLDLIEQRRPPGILSILDEESKFPKATDETFIQKLHGNYEGKHQSYDKPRLARGKFITKHYAGAVEYDVAGWRDKNKDELPEHLVELVRKSSTKFIAILYSPEGKEGEAPAETDDKKTAGKQTLGGFFKQQLTDLMTMLHETQPYFIRCIKPNMEKVSEKFDEQLVYNQLLYAGMLETIRIRRMGYPIRYKHEEFWRRYRVICPEVDVVKGDMKASCARLCVGLGIKSPANFQLGTTKVFLKQEMANELEDRRNVALTDIIKKIQVWWRMMNIRTDYCAKKEKSVVVQKWWRAAHTRKIFKKKLAGTIAVQRWWRMVAARKQYKKLLEKKRKEEEERRIREEKEREERIKKMGKDKVEAEEAAAREVEAQQKEAEMEKLRALASGEISMFDEPAAPPPSEEKPPEEEKKKKKKKKEEGDEFERDKRGSIMMKKGMQLEIPINVDGRVTLGLGWKGGQWDMDASCLMFRFKQHRDDVYYYKPRSKDGSVVHRGGYAGLIRINPEEGDAEQIDINLSKVSAKTNTLIFVVTVFSPEGNFSSVQDAYVRLMDSSTQSEYCRYTLEGGGQETARIMCRLYRYGYSKWRLQAIGEPSEGRLYKHMIPKVEPFLDDMPAKRRFRVRIHRGKLTDIKRMYKGEAKSTSLNTFCEIRFDTDKNKTKVIKKDLAPQWRSTAEVKGHSNVLEVNVMHKARFGKDIAARSDFRKLAFSDSLFLGRCLIPLEGDNVQIKEQWFKLEQRDKARGRGQTAVTGEIKLTIQELLY